MSVVVTMLLSCGCEYTLTLEPVEEGELTPEQVASAKPASFDPAATFACREHGVQIVMRRS